ncbi:MAG: acyl carrier protein [Ruminococcus sp.]|nr:acyl carrier protein [Ruminococcus sp.]
MNNLNWDEFRQVVSDYVGVDADEITRDTDVYDDLYLDSLGLFGLGSHITETYKLNIPLSLVASISKTGEIFDLLNEKGTPTEE